ncbi:MAG: rRNA methyltransferase [Hirschia sp.]|nr:rRNA methyltransferase [Hirschia sp.]MBF19402.1 rRNA methyltransferase [Hirschia sp.]
MRLAFYQPDIPQNLGSAIRIAACFGVNIDIIGPFGFPLTDKALRRSAMDYALQVDPERHDGWSSFLQHKARKDGRLVLFTTKAATPITQTRFEIGDTLLFGRESAGVPDEVHDAADLHCVIPMMKGARSLNVAVSAGIALHEALRQTDGLPPF